LERLTKGSLSGPRLETEYRIAKGLRLEKKKVEWDCKRRKSLRKFVGGRKKDKRTSPGIKKEFKQHHQKKIQRCLKNPKRDGGDEFCQRRVDLMGKERGKATKSGSLGKRDFSTRRLSELPPEKESRSLTPVRGLIGEIDSGDCQLAEETDNVEKALGGKKKPIHDTGSDGEIEA